MTNGTGGSLAGSYSSRPINSAPDGKDTPVKKKTLTKAVLGIFLIIGLAIMGGSVFSAYRTATKVKTVAAWPTAPAYIVESLIVWAVQGHEQSGTTRRSYSYEYRLPVLAGYRIDSEYYTSSTPAIKTIRDSKIFFRDPWKNPPDRDLVNLFKQVPSGTVVPIHYNPADKSEAYIFTDLPFWKLYTGPFLVFLFGILPSLFGLVPMLLLRKLARRKSGREPLPG